ncbi:hypothetical protein J0H58_14290 [bacterium]|nr:hypothetical protein [bacterium]
MSTESPTTPSPAETPAPGTAVRAAWQKFKRGELVPYWVMAAVLVLITVIGLFIFMRGQKEVASSRMWLDLEVAATREDLEKVMTDYPGTLPAQLAEVHLARVKLGPDGIDKLVTGDQGERQKALASIETAKESFGKLAPDLKDSPVLQAECYLGLAKAELALIGITKGTGLDSFRGSSTAAAEWLEKLAAVAEGSPWGDEAKKTAAELRAPGEPLMQDIRRVQTNLYNMTFFPSRPGGMFGPGGGMPFGPGGMPFGPGGGLPPGFPMGGPGGVPGLPGGGPVMPPLPPGHPPIAP